MKTTLEARPEKAKAQTIYFQLYLENLNLTKKPNQQYERLNFAIFRGKQKIQSTKIVEGPFQVNQTIKLNGLRLNFVVLHYTPDKREEFLLKINGLKGEEQIQIADFAIDCNRFVDEFKQSNNGAFEEEIELGEDYKITSDIFVEKTRFSVQKLVREAKGAKAKEGSKILFQNIKDKRKPRLTRDESPYRSLSRSRREHHFKRNSPKKETGETKVGGFFRRAADEKGGRRLKSKSKEKKEEDAPLSPPKTAGTYGNTNEELKPAPEEKIDIAEKPIEGQRQEEKIIPNSETAQPISETIQQNISPITSEAVPTIKNQNQEKVKQPQARIQVTQPEVQAEEVKEVPIEQIQQVKQEVAIQKPEESVPIETYQNAPQNMTETVAFPLHLDVKVEYIQKQLQNAQLESPVNEVQSIEKPIELQRSPEAEQPNILQEIEGSEQINVSEQVNLSEERKIPEQLQVVEEPKEQEEMKVQQEPKVEIAEQPHPPQQTQNVLYESEKVEQPEIQVETQKVESKQNQSPDFREEKVITDPAPQKQQQITPHEELSPEKVEQSSPPPQIPLKVKIIISAVLIAIIILSILFNEETEQVQPKIQKPQVAIEKANHEGKKQRRGKKSKRK